VVGINRDSVWISDISSVSGDPLGMVEW
jgi:hypothetical protein